MPFGLHQKSRHETWRLFLSPPHTTNALDRLSRYALVGLLTAPFLAYYHPAPLPSFYNEWVAGICLLSTLAALLSSPTSRIELPAPTLFLAAMGLLIGLQLGLGMIHYPSQGWLAIAYLIAATLLTLSVRVLMVRHGLVASSAMLAWSLLAAGILNGIAAILQEWNIHTFFDEVVTGKADWRAFGNLAQSNHFGDLEVLAACALVYLRASGRTSPTVAVPLGAVLSLGMVLSASRSIWLFLAAVTLLALLFHIWLRTDASRRIVLGSFGFLAAFVLIQVGLAWLTPSVTPLDHAGERLLVTNDNSIGLRLAFVDEAWRTFLAAPILGAGYEQFAWQHFLRQANSPNPIFFGYENLYVSHAHNLVFQVLAEFGLAGFAILASLVIWLLKAFRAKHSPEQWLVFALLAVLFAHSMLEYPLNYLYFLALFAILLTFASVEAATTLPARPIARGAAVAIVVGTVVLGLMMFSYRHLEQAYGGTSQRIVLNAETRDHLRAASSGGFFEPEIDHLLNILPVGLGGTAERALLLEISTRSFQHCPTAERAYRQVFLLAINGQPDSSARLLTMARAAYPNHFAGFVQQIENLLERHPDDRALRVLRSLASNPQPPG